VSRFIYCHAERHYAEFYYAGCHGALAVSWIPSKIDQGDKVTQYKKLDYKKMFTGVSNIDETERTILTDHS